VAIQKTGLSIRKGYILKFFWLLLISCGVLKAENFSIMLSLAEQEALQQAQGLDQQILDKVWGNEASKELETKSNQAIIFLSAVLYFSPDKWTVIINDQIITAQGYSQGIWLKSVTPDQIVFSLEEQAPLEFFLRINQSFLINEKIIIEGDQRTKSDTLVVDKDIEKVKS
jgi:hypothetical protein